MEFHFINMDYLLILVKNLVFDKMVRSNMQRSVILPENTVTEIKNLALGKSIYITDIGYYPKAKNHYRKREKGTQQFILIYCVEGCGWISSHGKKVNVNANQYFIIPKNTAHTYASDKTDPWSIYWVHFAGDLAAEYSISEGNPQSISPSKISRISDRIQLFEEILQNLEMGFSIENIYYANICLLHFLASFKFLTQFRQIRKTSEMDMTESSILYMKEHLKEKLTLKELASHAELSASHYSLVFKNKTGRAPMEYLIGLRIQHACNLLDHSSLKVNEIAQRVGYDDPYYFSRIFSKVMVQSPREYRKDLKG